MNTLELKNISKSYGKKLALRDCNIVFENGINVLLGPNGAGKSTMMSIIADLIKCNAGEVLWNGIGLKTLGAEYRNILGFLPQDVGFYKNFTANETLRYFASVKGIEHNVDEKIKEVLVSVNLSDCVDKKVGGFSGGMKQRLGIAMAILNKPKLLILDEPTAGLDPKERIRFREILEQMREDSVIIMSTHIVSDAEKIADRVVMLKSGVMCVNKTLVELETEDEFGFDRSPLESIYMKYFGDEIE